MGIIPFNILQKLNTKREYIYKLNMVIVIKQIEEFFNLNTVL